MTPRQLRLLEEYRWKASPLWLIAHYVIGFVTSWKVKVIPAEKPERARGPDSVVRPVGETGEAIDVVAAAAARAFERKSMVSLRHE
jgi:hypothetical protein